MVLVSISDTWITLLLFLVSLTGCALFAFLETSVATLRLFTIEELERSVNRYPRLFAALRFHRHRVLTTMVIANSGATVITTTFSTRLLWLVFKNAPHHLELPLTLLFSTAIMLMCGEVIPKHLAKSVGHHLIKSTLWATNITYEVLYPLVTVLTTLSERVVEYVVHTQALGEAYHDHVSREEVQFLIGYMHKAGTLSTVQHDLFMRVFSLNLISVGGIMQQLEAHEVPRLMGVLPRLSVTETAEEALALLLHNNLSEIGVQDAQGRLVGVVRYDLLVALLLRAQEKRSLDSVAIPAVSLQHTIITPPITKDPP